MSEEYERLERLAKLEDRVEEIDRCLGPRLGWIADRVSKLESAGERSAKAREQAGRLARVQQDLDSLAERVSYLEGSQHTPKPKAPKPRIEAGTTVRTPTGAEYEVLFVAEDRVYCAEANGWWRYRHDVVVVKPATPEVGDYVRSEVDGWFGVIHEVLSRSVSVRPYWGAPVEVKREDFRIITKAAHHRKGDDDVGRV